VNAGEVAVAELPSSGTAAPTACPPVAQPEAVVNGPHTKKATVPVGVPLTPSPVTVAESAVESPSVIALPWGDELVVDAAVPVAADGSGISSAAMSASTAKAMQQAAEGRFFRHLPR